MFEDLSLEMIQQSISEMRQEKLTGDNQTREKLKDFYEDRGHADVYLGDFGFKDSNDKLLIHPVHYNLTKHVIDKSSLLYKKPPQYDDEIYEEWNNENTNMFIAKQTAEKYKNLLHHVILRPIFFDDRIIPYLETDYLAHFTDNQTLFPYGYSIPVKQDVNDPKNINPEQWVFWSDKYYFFYDNNGKIIYDEEFPSGDNPYGVNPCVELIKNYPVDEYGGSGAQSLVDANQAINIAMANLNLMIHHQAFDQPYVTGADKKDAQALSPSTKLWYAPEGSNFGLLGYSPKIIETLEGIKFQITVISNVYNVNINWSIEGDVASGVALKIRNIDLIEAREADSYLAMAAEKKLYQVLKAMTEYHKLKPKLTADTISVNFYDYKFPMSIEEQIKKEDHLIKHNVMSVADLYKVWMDADVDDEEAQKQIQDNKQINGNMTRADQFKKVFEEEEEVNEG